VIPAVVAPFVASKIGWGAARRYCMTGEHFDAPTALRLGLVHELVDDLQGSTGRLLDAVLAAGPWAARGAKQLIRERPDAEEHVRRMVAARVSDEAREGLLALAERRAPDWWRPERPTRP
jgi:methylglutaconyl-CoA hydratase